MEFWDGFDLGYDLGFEDGSWVGYYYGIGKLKPLIFKQKALIVAGTIVVCVPLTLLALKFCNRIKTKLNKSA
ncbi:MAG: hypothetical protein ACNA7K_06085 [Acholeplasmataceae bacterium]